MNRKTDIKTSASPLRLKADEERRGKFLARLKYYKEDNACHTDDSLADSGSLALYLLSVTCSSTSSCTVTAATTAWPVAMSYHTIYTNIKGKT